MRNEGTKTNHKRLERIWRENDVIEALAFKSRCEDDQHGAKQSLGE